jgi:tetratricopeptide (TPR) repeat protein
VQPGFARAQTRALRPREPALDPASGAPDARRAATARPPDSGPASAHSEIDRLRVLLKLRQSAEVIMRARERAQHEDAFLLLLADALRAEGRFAEARIHYARLAARAPAALRVQAGFAAAQIAFVSVGDAQSALADLDRFGLDASGSPLAERASVLRAEALLALGRREQAEQVARAYLARQPDTEASARMRRILGAGR